MTVWASADCFTPCDGRTFVVQHYFLRRGQPEQRPVQRDATESAAARSGRLSKGGALLGAAWGRFMGEPLRHRFCKGKGKRKGTDAC